MRNVRLRLFGNLTFMLVMALFTPTCSLVPAHATVSTTAPRNDYVGNGATATYSYTFKIFTATDLRVTKRDTSNVETALTYSTDYTVTGAGSSSGGTITLTAGNLPSGYSLTIRFDRTPRQSTDLRNQGTFYPETHEDKFDELTRYSQQLKDVLDRSLHLPETEAGSSAATTLPAASSRASKFMAFDGSGNPVMASGTSANLTPVSSFINTLLDDASALIARATLGLHEALSTGTIFDAKGDLVTATAADTPVRKAVGSDGGVLTAASSQSDGLAYTFPQPNPIINGSLEIWQRGTSFAAAADGQFSADRFQWKTVGAGVVTLNRSTTVPSVANAGVLFNYSLEVDNTTADAAIAAADTYSVRHKIEGYNWRHFAQRQVTVSFWVSSSKTGTHSFGVRNSGTDRYYIAEYTVSVADTPEYKTITIPASPSAGTWDYTTGIGAELIWPLACGSNFQGTVGAWTAGALYCSSSQVNVMDSTANFFRITGVKMELGSVATPIVFVPFQADWLMCQRYYQKSFNYATAPAQNAGANTGEYRFLAAVAGAVALQYNINLPYPLRAFAGTTRTLYNPAAANGQVRNYTDAADFSVTTAAMYGERGLIVDTTGTAGTAVAETLAVHWAVDAEL